MYNKSARRMAAVILCVGMMMLLVACGGGGSDPAVGAYEFESMNFAGMEITKDSAAAMGLDVSTAFAFELKEDGTFTMKMEMETLEESEPAEGTWKKDGDTYTLTVDGEDVSGKFDSSAKVFTLSMEESGQEISLAFKQK